MFYYKHNVNIVGLPKKGYKYETQLKIRSNIMLTSTKRNEVEIKHNPYSKT